MVLIPLLFPIIENCAARHPKAFFGSTSNVNESEVVVVPESTDKEKEVVPYSSTKNGPTNSTTIRPIQASFGRQMDFRPGTPKESELTDRIAFMVAKDKLPISFVEGEGFWSLMKFIVRSYTVPCRQTIANRLKGR